jgi:hypothetical protein
MDSNIFFNNVYKVDKFSTRYKDNILSAIDSMGKYSLIDHNDNRISNTDYHMMRGNYQIEQKYLPVIAPIIELFNSKFKKTFGYNNIEVDTCWFQQYEKGDYHNTHVHPGCHFTNVLYVELPDKKISTKIIWMNQEYQIDVEEGDILTFPGYVKHYAPKNMGARKTSIVFNTVVHS